MKKLLALLALATLFFPSSVLAQPKINLTDGKYEVVVTHSPEVFEEGSTGSFSLQMKNLQGNLIVQSQAWVDIFHDGKKVFSSPDFRTVDGEIDFNKTFELPGEYEFRIRMINLRNRDEVNVAFALDVASIEKEIIENTANQDRNFALISLILGVIVGSALTASFANRKQQKENAE